MSDKPLHVRVAEALGCHPYEHDDYWFCDESGGKCKAKAENPYQHDGCHGSIALFDVDWSATGPWVEKYGITLERYQDHWAATGYPMIGGALSGIGKSATRAVCDLIVIAFASFGGLKEPGELTA